MTELIDDLLTLAREGQTATDTTKLDLATLAEDCWATVDTADATLSVETMGRISANESQLRELFENLFRNAVAHGGDDVCITVGESDGALYVEDDGPGVPPEDREQVFETGYSTSEDGTGLGLTIVQQVARAHDWDVTVTAGSDGGARFEITGVSSLA
ncbi:MAG: sensor histidine kinase [Halobacteriaceae archaeon]